MRAGEVFGELWRIACALACLPLVLSANLIGYLVGITRQSLRRGYQAGLEDAP